MEKLQSPEKIREDWRIDDFINKQYLCYNLRRCNYFSNHYILEYDVNDYDFHAEQISVKDQAENTIRLKTYLNKNREIVDLVQRQTEIELDIDLKEKKLYFRLKYFFHRNADTEELQRNKAIVLETFSYDEFRNLVQYVGYGDFEKDSSYDYLGYFSKIYQFYFQQASTPEQLMFLYTNTPDFVFKRMSLEDEKIMDHLLTLTEYDDTGFFSGWKDGSSALVNVLKAFSTNTYILNKFRKEPELCNRIYYNLDGVSFIDGKPQANRLIFANILMQYCLFSPHRPKEDAPTFHIGKNYKIATNVTELSGKWLGFGQSDEKTFFLKQQKEITQNVRIVAKEGNPEATEQVTEDLDKGKQYFPLEMVYFVNEDEKNINPETGEELPSVTMMVPAIYVKAMADAEKWEDINYFIRITADILAVVLGVATLATTGNPYLILAAMADLSLAGIDLTVQALRQEIAKLPGGEQFLKDWDLIYGVGGAIVAAPQLIVSAYRGIFVLLPNAAKNVQQGLRTMAISLFLDLNSGAFRRQDLRLFQPTEWVIPSAGFFSKTVECNALVQNGAFFMELDAAAIMESINKGAGINPDMIGFISPNRRFALVYKGEIVAEGSRYDKAYQKTLMELKRASYNVEKVGDILEEFYNLKHLPDDVLKHANLGEFALPGNPKKSTLPGKMKSGGHGQENIDYLNKIGRKHKIEHIYKNGVRIGSVDGHGDKYKRIIENVHVTGQSWFPKSWTKEKIKEAGRFVIEKNYNDFKPLQDGIPIFDNFEGVRVGVMKTNGKPKTIFPDNAKQPYLNNKNFESNPY
ncbi:EndoU domain-containing protein [uncultured Chryseobacterium sp.]|uniref:EndoU domain-containing protein n=1 Tax=uncultured Chryseobacterium sp. TaxID=259322 RepID=UPI0025E870C1|nr:EndoU domain-containing protein [uncultured Chryseobacterium sp.]